jgi:predicted dehydrogenase
MAAPATQENNPGVSQRRLPRIGFVGVGWIGAQRMKALAESGRAEIVAVTDSSAPTARAAVLNAPGAEIVPDLDTLLALDLDGVVIATPTSLHAAQAIACLNADLAVFCQKPLGCNAAETARVIAAARTSNRLLAVDMSYRFVRAMALVKELAASGAIGEIYACDLIFHNAYGPDKAWYYDRSLSGGGCVMDLGIHLIDLALWFLNAPPICAISSRRFAQGHALRDDDDALEDYAVMRLDFATGATASIACSWNLPAGQNAVIRAAFYGTGGGLAVNNINGSFYDFQAERFYGTAREILDSPPDAWGGRALSAWAARLAADPAYDPAIEQSQTIAAVIDAIYGCDTAPAREPLR